MSEEEIKEIQELLNIGMIRFIDRIIAIARENLPESHVMEIARCFAAEFTETSYADVPQSIVDSILFPGETEEDEEV